MPKVGDVSSLISAVGSKDFKRARVLIQQMIANEKNLGRNEAAYRLEAAYRKWGNVGVEMTELPQDIKGFVYDQNKYKKLVDVYLDEEIRLEIYKLFAERRKMDDLRDAGLPLRNKILLAGPPGNGKTTLAGAIAKELELPFLAVKMSEVISSSLGGSNKNINKLFERANEVDCVLFLDEFDTVGSARISGAEGPDNERNAIVNNLLTLMDRLSDTTLILAATNLPEELDSAILRRFNLKIWLDSPDDDSLLRYVLNYQHNHDVNFFLSDERIKKELTGSPWSKVEEFCIDYHRSIILGVDCKSSANKWMGKIESKNMEINARKVVKS